MKAYSIASSLVIIFLSITLASSDNLQDFLQCLPNQNINPSHPISDAIFIPANASFTSTLETYIDNRRFLTPTTPKPLAIVTAKHESHVQATIVCARTHGLQMRIRSGGHDYEGLSYISDVPFIILDMFNLRSIEIDIQSETAWVQAGATLGELYYNIANHSNVHAFPAGVCPTVGTGGHISGGGYGNLMRKYGLSVDHIIDAQVVDVNGNILNRSSMGEDYFWAIRGGGGASFGVILSWKIELVRVPPKVTFFKVDRNLTQGATDIIYRWQKVATKLDRNLFIRAMPQVVNVSSTNNNHSHEMVKKTIVVSFYGEFLGESKTLLALMNRDFPELGLQQSDCKEMRWIETTLFWFDLPAGTSIDFLLQRHQGAQIFYKNKSDFVRKVIPKEALRKIWKIMIQVGNTWMQWNPYGGIMSEIPETAVPFPHRAGVLFKIQYNAFWDDENLTARYLRLLREVFDVMTPYVSKDPREAFLNYRDIDIGRNPSNDTNFQNALVYGSKYFKGNFQRLVEVKGMVDPNNFFKNEQSIPPPLRT